MDLGTLRLDEADECLWRGEERIALRPKTYALLHYLVKNSGRLVTKDELLDAVWAGTIVGDAVLKVCVRELRGLLGDSARDPRFIETVHRRGYRFLVEARTPSAPRARHAAPPEPPARSTELIGRAAELSALRAELERARGGERRTVFVTGPPGIGKSALIDAFCDELRGADVRLASGQCLERFGTGEPYHPFLEAVGRLVRDPRNDELIDHLRRSAPTWLVQLPWLVEPDDHQRLEREILGATRERMLRELAEALEAWTADAPTVLVFEDLHWSDYSTLDLIGFLARRRDPARLLVVGTYRPVELILREHPLRELKHELELHRLCREVALELLDGESVREFVTRHSPDVARQAELAAWLHRRTDGNPLFLLNMLDVLREQGVLEREELGGALEELGSVVPDNLRRAIELQLDRCSARSREVLEAACLIGHEFSAAAVASALGESLVDVEPALETLSSQRLFLYPTGTRTFPDGMVSDTFAFVHELFRSVLEQGVPPGKRRVLQRRLGERGEEVYGARSHAIAGELAVHFEQGGRPAKALEYLLVAADNAARRLATREACAAVEHALELCSAADGENLAPRRVELFERLGTLHRGAGDMRSAASAFDAMAAAAREHAREREVEALLYAASAVSWIDREECLRYVDRALRAGTGDSHVEGYAAYWNLLCRGWTRADFERSAAAVESSEQGATDSIRMLHRVRSSFFLSWCGRYEDARAAARRGIALAHEVGDAFDALLGTFFFGWASLFSGAWGEALATLDEGLATAERNGNASWVLLFRMLRAWIRIEAGQGEQAAQELAEVRAAAADAKNRFGAALGAALHARALLAAGRAEEARVACEECTAALEAGNVLMDWVVRLILADTRATLAIEAGETVAARSAADELRALAQASAEPTWLAFADAAEALCHASERDLTRATELLQNSQADPALTTAPLAARRLHAAAATVAKRRRRRSEYEEHAHALAQVDQRLAASLDPDRDSDLITSLRATPTSARAV